MIKFLFTFIFLTIFFNPIFCFSQEKFDSAYMIIPKVIYQDTIPDATISDVFHKLIKEGRKTPKDSLNFVNREKDWALILVNWTKNTVAERTLAKAYLDSSEITQFIGKQRIMDIFDGIGPDKQHPEFLRQTGINVVEKGVKGKTNHNFSDPLEVTKDDFLIYHEKYNGNRAQLKEFIFYSVTEQGELIIKRHFEIWSIMNGRIIENYD